MSQINVNNIRAKDGVSAVGFPGGINATGVVTATSFIGPLTGNVTGNTSGTAGSLAAGATGADLTLSGNLTVNGTTTTIDTAVTAVDSLAVDGNVTALGNLGVGTATAGNALHVFKNGDGQTPVLFETSNATGKLRFYNDSNGWSLDSEGDLRFVGGRSGSGAPTSLHIKSSGTAIFKAGLAEKFNNTGGTMTSGTHAIQSGNIIRFTGNESGANALNITGIHSTLANGEALSFTIICTPNNSGYISGFNIDGVAPATSIYWSGGSAPTAGGASGRDVYTFTVLKTGTGTNAYEVYGAVTNYA